MAQRFGTPGLTGGLMSIKTIGGGSGGGMSGASPAQRMQEEQQLRKEEKERQNAKMREEGFKIFMSAMGGNAELGEIAEKAGSQFMSSGSDRGLTQGSPSTGGVGLPGQVDIRNLAGLQSPEFQKMAIQLAMNQAQQRSEPVRGMSQSPGNQIVNPITGEIISPAQPRSGVFQSPGTDFIDPVSGRLIRSSAPAPPTPSQQISQNKLDGINMLKRKKDEGTITSAEQGLLDKATFGGGNEINIDLSKGQLLTAATSLRKEFNSDKRVADFRILAPKFKNMLSFIERSNEVGRKGPTDIALSKTFQKLTDLMSSVREGEYETTFRGQSLMDKVRGGIAQLKEGGEGMTPEFRQELVDSAKLMFDDGKVFFNQAIEEKGTVADAFGIPRKQILGNIEPFPVGGTGRGFEDIFGLTPTATPGTAVPFTPQNETRLQELLRKQKRQGSSQFSPQLRLQ